MGKYCFGIDVGGTSVKCGLFQTDGVLVEKWEIPTRRENNGEAIIPDIAKTILDKIAERKMDKEDIDGVGIGVPGPVNERGEVPCAVNLYWGFKEVTKELSELTGLASKAGNDANVAALGEAWKGAAAGSGNVILVTLGTGVGGGIIVDGKIVGGAHGAGGEIGHAAVNHEEKEACNCGNCGCLEQYASATGIVRVAQRTLAATEEETVLRKFPKLSAKNVLDAFKDGDKVACDVMAQVGEMLGGTLAMFACVTDPEAIVIGGGVSKAGQPLIDCIQKYYEKYAFTACKKTPIILATLGNDAGIYGSVTHANMASVPPSISPTCAIISQATLSPSLKASRTFFAESFVNLRRTVCSSVAARVLCATRTIPVADAYCSRHPQLPQLQASFSSWSTAA